MSFETLNNFSIFQFKTDSLDKIPSFFFLIFSWTLLEVLDKVSPGSVNWKHATKPPIKMPFRKVENCNQVVKIGRQLKLSLVNVAGNDFVQGNKKLILGNLVNSMTCLS